MQEETSNKVTDQANTETNLGQGIDTVEPIEDSLGNEDNLEQDVCCTLQEYDGWFDVGHVAVDGKKVDGCDGGVGDDADVDAATVTGDDVVVDSDTLGTDDRDVESGSDNDDEGNDGDGSLCCRCIVCTFQCPYSPE